MEDSVPSSFSWKTLLNSIIPIRDQAVSPYSWAFAAAALVSYEVRIHDNLWDFEASAQHLIDHCQIETCEMLTKTRSQALAVLQYIQDHGVTLQTRYPYRGSKLVGWEIPDSPKIRIGEIVRLHENVTHDDIRRILLKHPIIATIDVYPSLLSGKFPHGQEDVYVENTGDKAYGTQYLLIVGYGNKDGRNFYEVHNSWGHGWGNRGYGRIVCQLLRPFAYVKKAHIKQEEELILSRGDILLSTVRAFMLGKGFIASLFKTEGN